jgi:hypothetical protein
MLRGQVDWSEIIVGQVGIQSLLVGLGQCWEVTSSELVHHSAELRRLDHFYAVAPRIKMPAHLQVSRGLKFYYKRAVRLIFE